MKFFSAVLILLLTFSCKTTTEPEDFKIIATVLYELEQREWLAKDIYPIMPPPPESREYFIETQDDLTPQEASVRFDTVEIRYHKYLTRISQRKVDSTRVFMATSNYLAGGPCKGCRISPDSLKSKSNYKRYEKVLSNFQTTELAELEIPFEQIEYLGKYHLKSIDDFPPREDMYNGTLSFLSGGELDFTRFYQQDNLGLIYFSISHCEMDCGAGYLVLLERKNGEWKIFDIILQWIS